MRRLEQRSGLSCGSHLGSPTVASQVGLPPPCGRLSENNNKSLSQISLIEIQRIRSPSCLCFFQVGLPSLLTAVLLRAAPPKTTPEQAAAILPANFEEVATLVLRVLNNLARLDLKLFQAQLVGDPVFSVLFDWLLLLF